MSLSFSLRLTVGALALVLAASAGRPALAQTANLEVTAQVQAACTLDGGSLAFGVYEGDQNDAEGTFTYQCTSGTNITISLDQGSNAQGGQRTMVGGGSGQLPYELYTDAARSDVWGADADGYVVEGTTANLETAQVYGRIAAGLQAPAGDYSDTVHITLEIN